MRRSVITKHYHAPDVKSGNKKLLQMMNYFSGLGLEGEKWVFDKGSIA